MIENLKLWVLAPIVTTCALGVLKLLIDMNTYDAEIIPKVEKLEEAVIQNSLILKNNSVGLKQISIDNAFSGYSVGLKQMSELESKNNNEPTSAWSRADQELYEVAKRRTIVARETIAQ